MRKFSLRLEPVASGVKGKWANHLATVLWVVFCVLRVECCVLCIVCCVVCCVLCVVSCVVCRVLCFVCCVLRVACCVLCVVCCVLCVVCCVVCRVSCVVCCVLCVVCCVFFFVFLFFIYFALPTIAGSPQQHMPITVGPFCLTHPVNFPCGRKPEYSEETHHFRQSFDLHSFHMRTGIESH